MSQSTQLPWRRRGTLDFLFHCEGRPGVWEARRYNVFIERVSLPMDLYAPLLTVDVTLQSCLVPPLTLLGLEPGLHSAAQMESICDSLGTALDRSWQAWSHPG